MTIFPSFVTKKITYIKFGPVISFCPATNPRPVVISNAVIKLKELFHKFSKLIKRNSRDSLIFKCLHYQRTGLWCCCCFFLPNLLNIVIQSRVILQPHILFPRVPCFLLLLLYFLLLLLILCQVPKNNDN